MDTKVEITGANEAIAKIRKLGPEFRKRAGVVVAASALNIEREAKQRAPVDTGRLRSSIRSTINQGALKATVGTDVEYAVYLEHGDGYTHRAGPRKGQPTPFLFPAFEQERPKFEDALERVIVDAAEEAG